LARLRLACSLGTYTRQLRFFFGLRGQSFGRTSVKKARNHHGDIVQSARFIGCFYQSPTRFFGAAALLEQMQ
jgi:hypothetical protein